MVGYIIMQIILLFIVIINIIKGDIEMALMFTMIIHLYRIEYKIDKIGGNK